jgi:hypothetical protein
MENRRVYATLWEDDAGAGRKKANEKIKTKTLPSIVKNGIAEVEATKLFREHLKKKLKKQFKEM